ncbi:MAG: threonine--tRNA ligase [Flavobacteriaceae bacterium]|nr:threonine--tRNA ligase [Flavobacteriaceae bacterium]|tara:strand:+ start:1610 stop:3556 length:1947 start_codon:yes stop_codon:yes gene_type:complete
MIEITFPDGAKKSFEKGISVIDVAKSISEGLSRKVLSAKYNDKIVESSTTLNKDGDINFFTWDQKEGKAAFWHSSSHVLAEAILFLYPMAKLTIGPPVENGFYYDVDFGDINLSEKNLQELEAKFIELARKKSDFKMRASSKSEALNYYTEINNEFKVELINDLEDGEITFCDHSNFTDLCRGGHIPNTGLIKAVKLTSIAGAYWRGDENRKQLTRIYGISFPKQIELSKHLEFLEEAKKRDHRKIGKELELFTFSKKVGVGLPLWLPKGADLRERLENFLKKAQKKAGYEQVISPHIANKELYVTSGHFQKYGSDSFQPIETPSEGESFLLKPMNCPHHCEIYKSRLWSYKELPIRYAEFGTVYRYEQSGELHGLTRVRSFTQDDAHIFCTPDQLNEEFKNVIELVLYVFNSLGFNDFEAQVSLRDKNNSEKYIGSKENWELAENAIINATEEKKLNYVIEYGEAAFYGPKLDFMVKDALGRRWQLGTIQVDYNLPERFELTYKGDDNKPHRPVMIHRAPFGSLERFVAILLEHSEGNLPIWLVPKQVIILCVSEKHEKYAQKVLNYLENNEIRASLDSRNETIGKKIRQAEISKIPFMLVIGEKEFNTDSVSIRKHKQGDIGSKKLNEFASMVKSEVDKSISIFKV